MRKIIRFFAFATAAVAMLVSCNKEIETPEVQEPLKLVLRANSPATKTAITDNGDGSYTPSWVGTTDKIGVFFTSVTGTPVSFTNTDTGTGATAWFEPDEELTGLSGDQTLYSLYPYSAFHEVTSGKVVRVNVKTDQVPTAVGTFDPAADILVAEPYAGNMTTISEDGGIIDLAFARILSVVKIIPADATTESVLSGEYVKSIKISYNGSGEDAPLTGRVALNLDSGELGAWSVKTYSANVTYDDDAFALNGTNAAYLIVNPATIAAGKTVTFTVKTNKHDVTKEVNLAKALAFPAGNIAKINLALNDACTIVDNTIDPNIIFSTPFYADISSNTSYEEATHGNLGVVGSSKSTITYAFDGTNQLRNNVNKISDDDASFYWCTSSTGLAIDGINVGSNQYFTLSFDRKVPSGTATLAIKISNDGTHFFPITSSATVSITGTTASSSSYNFSIPSGEYTNLKIRFENSGNGISIDNVTLTKLAAAGASNNAVSFDVLAVDPTLEVTPNPVNLFEGATQQLTVTGTNGALTYVSNDPDVATVTSDGLVTAVSEGTTTISITSAATVDYNAGATSVTVNVSAGLSFETIVISESWSANLKNSTGNNSKFVDDGQGIWTTDATYGHKAANNATAASFYSPKFDMSSVEAGTITFSHTGNVTGTSYQSLGKAYYTLDDGANWTQITLENPTKNWDWKTASISSAVYAGETIQFRWDFQGNASQTWEVKDFVITVPEHSITVNGKDSPLTIELDGDATKSTTLTIASNYTWSVKSTTGQPANYTYTKDLDTQITVTPAADNTSGSKNTGIGTMVLTDGVVDYTITFDQANKSNGGSETITFSDLYNSNTTLDGTNIAGTNFSVVFNKRSGGTATQYYTNGTAVRWYGGGTLGVSAAAGKTITGISIAYTTHDNSVTANVGSYTDAAANGTGTWSGSASSVTFTQGGTSGHCRIKSITVTYE